VVIQSNEVRNYDKHFLFLGKYSVAISPRLKASIRRVPILFKPAFTNEPITDPSVTFVKRITLAAARSTKSIALSGKSDHKYNDQKDLQLRIAPGIISTL
jgi:hypothetical protein